MASARERYARFTDDGAAAPTQINAQINAR